MGVSPDVEPQVAAPDESGLIGWLAEHEAPCPSCGYSLRGLTTPACPECAAPLRLGVSVHDPRPIPWVVAIVSLAMGLGFDAVVALLMTAAYVRARILNLGLPPPFFFVIVAGFAGLAIAMAATVWVLYRQRYRWAGRPRRRQWCSAAAVFLGVGCVHAIWGAIVISVIS